MNIQSALGNSSVLLGFLLGFVLCIVFIYLVIDNFLLRKRIFKMYERLLYTEKNKNHKLDYDKILKGVK